MARGFRMVLLLMASAAAPALAQSTAPQQGGGDPALDQALNGMVGDIHQRNAPPPVQPGMALLNAGETARAAAEQANQYLSENEQRQFDQTMQALQQAIDSVRRQPKAGQAGMAGACRPGPRCQALAPKIEAYMARLQQEESSDSARQSVAGPGVHAISGHMYCLAIAGAEYNRICGDELRQLGRPDCADQAYQQAQADTNTARGARAAQDATRASNAGVEACQWQ